ncbi:hypothetical protein Glove_13g285 [Diversispora epigaea]|uniref:BTB domain-containing protein n=1 Tax=Diversispora epigaea TaxID=1348612 RepID=A0A397JMF3_9GLOM|nr:hypothetical protein Glove_13g285 [Diversispora epigaea]
MALNFYENLSSDFIKLLEKGNEHNIIIEVGESSIKQPFKVHSTVLCYRCPYLYDEFKKSTISNDDNIRIIQKPQISAKIFDIIIKYIYGATVNLEKVETSVIFNLLMTANEFQLEELMTRLQTFLIENQSSWLKLNFSKIYNSSFQTNNLKALQNYCNDIIAKHPNLIFESTDFNTLPEAALKPQISAKIFDIIIKYIYGATVNLEKVETSVIFNLLMTANEFQLEELMTRLQTFLIENQSSWLKLNFSKIYNSSFQTNNLKALQNYCNDIIAKHPNLIFESTDFNTLPEAALVSIIQRDDLQLEESKIWDYVIQWGISQNKTVDGDKNFQILKNTLQLCLPHIRYFQISSENIIEKVFPYRQILDEELWADILKYSMAPNKEITSKILPPRKIFTTQLPNREYIFQITSSIINIEQATEITSWVDKKEVAYDINNNPYEFNLILHGSRDGFEPKVFWNLCDRKTNVIVVAKVKDTNEIIGGYNPIGWNSNFINQFSESNGSFIFSLKNGNIKNSILSRVKNAEHAIYNSYIFGPCFNNDLYMDGTQTFQIFVKDYYYENLIRKTTGQFYIVDYEVFQIKKR